MKISNTLIMNETLLPNSKKAFTLAEVLITLSILGVVAALTIPSLVNRQSEMAAIVKVKKAISQFEQVAEVYMAENNETNINGMIKNATCDGLTEYFKMVNKTSNCIFTTADGVQWNFKYDANGSSVFVYDSNATTPKYGAYMWANDGSANHGTAPTIANGDTRKKSGAAVYNANDFLKISKPADATAKTGSNYNITRL